MDRRENDDLKAMSIFQENTTPNKSDSNAR